MTVSKTSTPNRLVRQALTWCLVAGGVVVVVLAWVMGPGAVWVLHHIDGVATTGFFREHLCLRLSVTISIRFS